MHYYEAERRYRDGELTVDQIVEMIASGDIYIPPPTPPVDPKSPYWWDDVTNRVEPAPFNTLVRFDQTESYATLTLDEYERIREAIAQRRGLTYLPLRPDSIVPSQQVATTEPAAATEPPPEPDDAAEASPEALPAPVETLATPEV